MLETIFEWVLDLLPGTVILDLCFIVTDLVDIPLSEAERLEIAAYDALACTICQETLPHENIPLGKRFSNLPAQRIAFPVGRFSLTCASLFLPVQ